MSEDKRSDEVIRVRKSPNRFVVMDKTFLEDSRLSYKAKGILAYLLSKPDDWKVIVGNLVNYSADGKASVYAGLKELKEYGYYEKVPIRNEQGTRIVRWESTIYENPSLSLLTDFQEIENLNIENQLIENRGHTNNYNTKKLKANNNHVTSCQKETDHQADMQEVLCLIRKNIDYAGLKIAHSDDMALVDEFVNIILDALLSQSKTIRINGESKPRELVKSNLMKLTYFDIEHVLMQFKKQEKQIKKKQQYILSMLYHSPMELNAHYANLVQHDSI